MKILSSMLLVALVFVSSPAYAHPGRTDANGGHTCYTNCEKYGLKYGEYHIHNAPVAKNVKSEAKTTKTTSKKIGKSQSR